MGAGSNGQGSGGGNGGKGGNPQGNKPSGSGAQNTTTRKVSLHRLQGRPRTRRNPAIHRKRIRRNAIASRRSATVWRKQAKPHHDARARRQAAQEKPGTVGPGRAIIKHLGS